MIMAIFTLLLYALAFAVIWWAVEYTITHLPVPNPPANFVRIAVVIIGALIFVTLILSMAGVATGVDLPRLG